MKFLIAILLCANAYAHVNHRADGHAPIGVMGDHGHAKGDLMFSARYMQMQMNNMWDDSSETDVFDDSSYMMSPKKMSMSMTMLGAMYGIADKWTLMAMIPYLQSEMTMERKMGGDDVEANSSGVGDITLTGMYEVIDMDKTRLYLNLGLQLPTGSTTQDDNDARLGYAMQTGAGSYAFVPSVVYSRYQDSTSYGIQFKLKAFLGENSEEYTRGNEYLLNLWGSYLISENISTSLRLEHLVRDPIKGEDEEMGSMSPVLNSTTYHGQRSTAFVGLNYLHSSGHRLALEYGVPVSYNVSGPQMSVDSVLTLGWQKAF